MKPDFRLAMTSAIRAFAIFLDPIVKLEPSRILVVKFALIESI